MSIEHKVQNETGRNPYRIGANVLLLVAFFLLFHPLLSRGSLMYQPTISHWLTAGAFVPLVLRPWRRNHPFAENHTRLYAAVLLVHDVLLFLSAAAVSLILVEYMVKGCVITLKQSFFQGWICYVAVYAAAYLICGNVRIGVCLGMAISMIHGMIDHYVTGRMNAAGCIFDGFPRTTVQAEEFDKILAGHGLKVDVMIDIHVPEEELVRRILLRGKDSGRADDASEEVIRGRLDVYREQTAVVADYYAAQGKYASVNGTGTMEEVFSRIAAVIDGLK